ncbi:MAG TPA: type II toxin-antitoxin system VapB family antitoxin [Candidatus Methylomirabilis sp.]|nr:type II toxin-antitoxin system VapB family antitoxin [Candidatus Methylomirabilis sp.]
MRTTIDLPDDLLARAKRFAADTKRPLRAVIEDALREALGRRRTSTRSAPVKLTTFGTSGLQPGVDLDDSAALLDLLDAPR